MFIIIDALSNLADCLLLHYLLSHKLVLRAPLRKRYWPLLVFFTIFMLLKLPALPTSVSFSLLLLLYTSYARSLSDSSWNLCIFWSVIFVTISMIADETCYLVISIWNPAQIILIESHSIVRLIAMAIYYPILGGGCYVCAKKTGALPTLPSSMMMLLYLTILCGVIMYYTQIDLTVLLTQEHQSTGNPVLLTLSLLVSILLIVFFIFLIVLMTYAGHLYLQNQDLQLRYLQTSTDRQQYQTYQETAELIRQWRHDYRHHILLLAGLASSGKWNTLLDYLNELKVPMENIAPNPGTGNEVLDTLLASKITLARQNDIEVDWSIYLPDKIPLSDMELTSIISNILDNAIEACHQLPPDMPRSIQLKIKPHRQVLVIHSENTTLGNYRTDNHHNLLSTKIAEGHGYGIRRVQQLVSNHGGTIEFYPGGQLFSVQILLPIYYDKEDQLETSTKKEI